MYVHLDSTSVENKFFYSYLGSCLALTWLLHGQKKGESCEPELQVWPYSSLNPWKLKRRSIIDLSHWKGSHTHVTRLCSLLLASQDARSLLHHILRLLGVRGEKLSVRAQTDCGEIRERGGTEKPHCALSIAWVGERCDLAAQRYHGPYLLHASLCTRTGLCKKALARFGEFCSCRCLPLLPQLSSIHITWPKPFSRLLYICSGVQRINGDTSATRWNPCNGSAVKLQLSWLSQLRSIRLTT